MSQKELPFIQEMFDKIAPKYDFLNRALSLKQDVYWRRETVFSLGIKKETQAVVLDVACGTCDVALEILEKTGSRTTVAGVDFSLNMLNLGQQKVIKQGMQNRLFLLAGNALELPFEDSIFDAVTIAFGIRNIADKKKALEEFFRCLKPGGTLAVLELSTPENRMLKTLYLFYFLKILPLIGGFFSKNRSAYMYLPESVLRFPPSKNFAQEMEEAGFKEVVWRKMTLGIVTLFLGVKNN